MLCPKCLGKTRVIDSRIATPEGTLRRGWQGWLTKVEAAFDWYSKDWRARRRKCKECAHVVITIEVFLEDFSGAVEDAKLVGVKEQRQILGKLLKEQQRKILSEIFKDEKIGRN